MYKTQLLRYLTGGNDRFCKEHGTRRVTRKEASVFIVTEFRQELENTLLAMGVPADQFKLSVEESDVEDGDPQVLELGDHSALVPDAYIAERVLIEISVRSEQ